MSKKAKQEQINEDPILMDYFKRIAPSVVKFFSDHFICGSTYRCVWAIREYPTQTEEQAILKRLGEKDGITLHIYTRQVTMSEERKIIQNASNRNRMRQGTTDMQESISAANDLQDVATIITDMHKHREPLLHTAVYIELTASDLDALKILQTEVLTEMMRSKINVDKLYLRQKEGWISVMPSGYNAFKDQFERVLPASSAANLYPFAYSGKTDANGFYLGRDRYGSNIIVDFNRRDSDKTNSNVLILGNAGQGKSYLMKLLLTCARESGKKIISLDPEDEYIDLTYYLNGSHIDLMSGRYIINILEPKLWHTEDDGEDEDDGYVPAAFRAESKLSQHISFLRDFFRIYKSFSDPLLDILEILLEQLYSDFDITNETDFSKLDSEDYPILSDLYELIEKEFKTYDKKQKKAYTESQLQELYLGLHSICIGSDSKYFNGTTNIETHDHVNFGCKGLMEASVNLRDAMLFNILSYMSNALLTLGNTVASIDEFYLFLSNRTAVEYVRNLAKRDRKRDSAVMLASQNLEDFNLPEIKELTKPLFAIPTHVFLFNGGNIDAKFYMDTLQLEQSEYNIIRYPKRGSCLYKCGNERYNLLVKAPAYKEKLFGNAGGR